MYTYIPYILDCQSQVAGGYCNVIGDECWCYHEKNTAGYLVCGYPKGYSSRYYSIAKDSLFSPWTIIRGLAKDPDPSHCTSDETSSCDDDCATNRCGEKGCWGTDLSCDSSHFTWNDTNIFVSGKPFYFRGFGKHEDSDIRGKGLDMPTVLRDFELIKI